MEDKKTTPVEREPKRESSFVVEFPKESSIEPWFVRSIDRPKLVDLKWQNIEIEFIDVIAPSTSEALYKFVLFLQTQTENKILFSFYIKSIDPTGLEVEKWLINVAEVPLIDFGKYDYGDSKMQTCKMIVKPFSCIIV